METTSGGLPRASETLLPFTAGLLAGGLHLAPGCGAVLFVAAAVAAAGAQRFHDRVRVRAAATAAGVACGALSAVLAHAPVPPDHVARLAGAGIVAVDGTIVRSETSNGRVTLVVAVASARGRRHHGPAQGLLGVTIAHAAREWPVGAQIRFVGPVRRPRNFADPGAYDHAGALARRGIRATAFVWDDRRLERLGDGDGAALLDRVRRTLADRIAANADGPVRGYLTAVLLGATQGLDRDTRRALTRTGLAHVVSVSGFHIAVAAGAAVFAFRWLLLRSAFVALRVDVTKVATMLGLVPVGAYAALAGGRVPAARAFLTYAAVLGALALDRSADGLRALAVAAILLAGGAPDVAADVSFELSFVSVLALILVGRRPSTGGNGGGSRRRCELLRAPIRTSVAATIATAPLTAWHFQQVSLIAPLANLVALPLLGPMTLLPGLVALPLVALSPPIADGLLRLAARAAGIGLATARWLAAWPWASLATPLPSLLEVGLAYAILGLWWLRAAPAEPHLHRARRVAAVVVALCLAADVGFWTWERVANPTLRITFLSVGQGDAAVVELPRRGGVMVIDGGGFPGDLDPGERLIAPFLRSRKILHVDVLVLSHPQLDHYGGLASVAEQFGARELWWNGMTGSGPRFEHLLAVLAAARTHAIVLRAGMRPPLAGPVVADVLHPSGGGLGVNDASLVVRLRFGSTAVLFTGDIEQPAERMLLAHRDRLRSDVLKVPHHGSATSSSATWLAAVSPRIAVISSGADNRFGFPARAVVQRLRAVGASVWNTATDGAVRVISDGRQVRVAPTRASAPERFVFPQLLW